MVVNGTGSSTILTLSLLNAQMPAEPVTAILAQIDGSAAKQASTSSSSALLSVWKGAAQADDAAVADALAAYGDV